MAAAARGGPAFVSQHPSGTQEGAQPRSGHTNWFLAASSVRAAVRKMTGGWGLLRLYPVLLQPLVQSRGELGGFIASGIVVHLPQR